MTKYTLSCLKLARRHGRTARLTFFLPDKISGKKIKTYRIRNNLFICTLCDKTHSAMEGITAYRQQWIHYFALKKICCRRMSW